MRHALVEGEWNSHHRFVADNRALLERAGGARAAASVATIWSSALDDLERLYDERVPADVVSGRHFDSWWKKARRTEPDLLTFTADDLLHDAVDELDEDDVPGRVGPGRPHLRAQLRVRAGHHRRRRRRAHPGGGAQPGAAHRLRLAGAGTARGAGGRADPLAAQGPAPQPGAGARHRPGLPRSGRADGVDPEREPLLDALERELGRGRRRAHPSRRLGSRPAASASAPLVPRGRRRGHAGGAGRRPRRAEGGSRRRGARSHRRAPAPTSSRPASPSGASGRSSTSSSTTTAARP